ncbi:DNA polymerase III subunit alpha, partial [bacterium]|nr:DNA polymerase III subunit alpha [bacterium]
QERTAKAGNRFAFVSLSDASGVFEVTLFAETLAVSRELLEPGRAVLLTVDIQPNGEEYRLTCQEVKPLEEEIAKNSNGLKIVLRDPSPLPGLKEIVDKLGRGKGEIHLLLELDALREADVVLPGAFALTPQTRAAVKGLAGVVEVVEM